MSNCLGCESPLPEGFAYNLCDVCWERDFNYYDRKEVAAFLATPVKEGCRRWVCNLCGFPQGDFLKDRDDIGVFGCGGCGQHCVRPLEEQ